MRPRGTSLLVRDKRWPFPAGGFWLALLLVLALIEPRKAEGCAALAGGGLELFDRSVAGGEGGAAEESCVVARTQVQSDEGDGEKGQSLPADPQQGPVLASPIEPTQTGNASPPVAENENTRTREPKIPTPPAPPVERTKTPQATAPPPYPSGATSTARQLPPRPREEYTALFVERANAGPSAVGALSGAPESPKPDRLFRQARITAPDAPQGPTGACLKFAVAQPQPTDIPEAAEKHSWRAHAVST